MNKYYIYFLYFLIFPINLTGQELKIETGGIYSSGEKMPYYIISNQAGIFDKMHSGEYLRGKFHYDFFLYDSLKWYTGSDLMLRYDGKGTFSANQWYAGIKNHYLCVYVGARNDFLGNQDTLLSSGGAIWSGNAPPIPRIMISTNDFVRIAGINWLHFRAGIAHGWLGSKNSYVKNAYLHQKYFYLRIGNLEKIALTLGIQHHAQWGGISPKYGQLPDNLNSFFKVFLAYNNEDRLDPYQSGMPENEARNRIGNHLGTKDVGIDWNFSHVGKIKLYWQNFIEDITGAGFRNAMDGLWGISFVKQSHWRINYEFIRTYTYYVPPAELIPTLDNYFNNGIYRSGWTYQGYVIGTPLITSPVLLSDTLLGQPLINNRIIAHHLATSLSIKKIALTIQFLYSRNFGNCITIYSPPKKQYSYSLLAEYPDIIKNMDMLFLIAFDKGNLLENKWGFKLCFVYWFNSLFSYSYPKKVN